MVSGLSYLELGARSSKSCLGVSARSLDVLRIIAWLSWHLFRRLRVGVEEAVVKTWFMASLGLMRDKSVAYFQFNIINVLYRFSFFALWFIAIFHDRAVNRIMEACGLYG